MPRSRPQSASQTISRNSPNIRGSWAAGAPEPWANGSAPEPPPFRTRATISHESPLFIAQPIAGSLAPLESLDALEAAFGCVSDAVIIFCPHRATVLFANAAVTLTYGTIAQKPVGLHLNQLFPRVWGEMVACAGTADETVGTRLETILHAPDGGDGIVIEVVVRRMMYVGGSVGVCAIRDAVKLQRTTRSLNESLRRTQLITSVTSDGIWEWDLKTNGVEYSPQWGELVGCSLDEMSISPNEWFIRIHPDDVERVHSEIAVFLEGTSDGPLESRHRLLHKNGTYRWMLARIIAVRSAIGELNALIGAHCDVTERRNAEEQLEHKALSDPLTDLANRALFMERLAHSVRRLGLWI